MEHRGEEINILKSLKHEGIPRIIDSFWEREEQCIVMEYIEGKTLKEWKECNGRCNEKTAYEWMVQIAEILRYLHESRPEILYLDLKPENILITAEGKIRLVDFGAAFSNKEKNRKEGYFGTIGYASPEQLEGMERIDGKSDIYSLGAVIYFLLSRRFSASSFYKRKDIREENPAISKKFTGIIQKCMEENKEKRFQTMAELMKVLKHYKTEKSFVGKIRKFLNVLYYLNMISLVVFSARIAEHIFIERWRVNRETITAFMMLLLLQLLLEKLQSKGRKRKLDYKILANHIYTDKKGLGLFSLLFLIAFYLETAQIFFNTELGNIVWMKDDYNRRVLMKENGTFHSDSTFLLEHRSKKSDVLYQFLVEDGSWKEIKEEKLLVRTEALQKKGRIGVSFREVDFSGKKKKIYRQNFILAYKKKEPEISISDISGERYANN